MRNVRKVLEKDEFAEHLAEQNKILGIELTVVTQLAIHDQNKSNRAFVIKIIRNCEKSYSNRPSVRRLSPAESVQQKIISTPPNVPSAKREATLPANAWLHEKL